MFFLLLIYLSILLPTYNKYVKLYDKCSNPKLFWMQIIKFYKNKRELV